MRGHEPAWKATTPSICGSNWWYSSSNADLISVKGTGQFGCECSLAHNWPWKNFLTFCTGSTLLVLPLSTTGQVLIALFCLSFIGHIEAILPQNWDYWILQSSTCLRKCRSSQCSEGDGPSSCTPTLEISPSILLVYASIHKLMIIVLLRTWGQFKIVTSKSSQSQLPSLGYSTSSTKC